ncbi:unnamed protein product [Adineta steineri]|uniref:Uncharacterized protein n=1 Tax=Adineta steineri TaxID=433720 RepID=A0A814PBG8_9BILA|nr:unnamed protein product [Adineta steineri]
MNPTSANSGSLGLNTIVSTLVQNSSTRPPSTTIVSNIQNASSPVNLFTNLPGGLFAPNNNNNNNNNSINSSTANQGQLTSSRLKVEDALNYLDKVKNQFALQPQVYNQFLDIMKEFKSQSIDTQEVINRVSTLFHGHPDLIVGFNTFLPPGYKIEVSEEHHGYIQVTHPSSRTESIAIGGPSNTTYNLSITTPTTTYRQTANLLSQDNDETDLIQQQQQLQLANNATSQAVNALISAATAPQVPFFGTTGGLNLSTKNNKQPTTNVSSSTQATTVEKTSSGQPVEFNHAINYVNKIKNRFHQSSWTRYVESYIRDNEGDHDEAITARIRSKLRKNPRFLLRNIKKPTDMTDRSLTEVTTTNNDYCRLDTKTLKRKPCHRAGFYFYKRNSLRSTKQNHKRLSTQQFNHFSKYYQDWSSKHTSDNDTDPFNDLWLKTHRSMNNNTEQEHLDIQSNLTNDLTQPPYRHYRHYQIVNT